MIKFIKFLTKRKMGSFNNLKNMQKNSLKKLFLIQNYKITLSVYESDEVEETLVSSKNSTNR